MAEVTYQAPEKRQGTVTIVLTEDEARAFSYPLVSMCPPGFSVDSERYVRVRDSLRHKVAKAISNV